MNLRRVFADICRGYSVSEWHKKTVYIKHLTHFDQVGIDEIYDGAFKNAVERGIRTKEAKLELLKGMGLWVIKDEVALKQQEDYVKGLRIGKSKMIFNSQIEAQNKVLAVEETKLSKMVKHKEDLIDLTAEEVGDRRVQFTYLSQAFYPDKSLTHPLFSDRDMHQMDDDQIMELLNLYIESTGNFTSANIKNISVASYFTNLFYLCGDNITSFFGKPMCELTAQQSNLISYGMYYKNILTNHDVPEEMRSNPDRLEEYVNRNTALQKVLAKTEGAARVGLVASAEDFKAMGLTNSTEEIQKTVAKEYKNGMEAAKDLGYKIT